MARFIAEIGSNHNRDSDRCLALVDAAASAGCAAVKLQIFRVDDLFAAEALQRDPKLAARRAWEFPIELLGLVRERCAGHGLQLGVTPFSPWAVEAVLEHVDFFKISSYDLLRRDLIGMCAASGKPLILSTGMATLAELASAVAAAEATELRLLHCVSGYPTPPEQANLAAIETLGERFGVPVGWSDHTRSELVVRRAVTRWHACDVEVHIDLDGGGREAGEHNWEPWRLGALIASLRSNAPSDGRAENVTSIEADAAELQAMQIDGDGIKHPMPVELPDIPWRADPADGLRPLRTLRAELAAA
jgi:N-acetylneuraminate synthase